MTILDRRAFLKALVGAVAAWNLLPRIQVAEAILKLRTSGEWVNDIHTQLNRTWVFKVAPLSSVPEMQALLSEAKAAGKSIAIAGGRHAGGGQQFASNEWLVDTRPFKRVLDFDSDQGTITVEAGIQWPDLIRETLRLQEGKTHQWGIIQKPTGTDHISIGGSLSSNVHGRGLTFKPFIQDVESFILMNADGQLLPCSRTENPELFRLAIGGYGLFGLITSVTLRLQPRQQVQRMVQMTNTEQLIPMFQQAIRNGAKYGDFQFKIDPASEGFLTEGIFAAYQPLGCEVFPDSLNKALSVDAWAELVYLAHVDKKKAFEKYSSHYLETAGQIYWNDTNQVGPYKDGYHELLDRKLETGPATEGITELYVPPETLPDFMNAVAADFRKHKTDLIYGTIRMIRRDDESFLPWARQDYACVIFNLHTPHSKGGIAGSKAAFRRLTDRAIERGGSYYMTYHRYARKDQVLACYPQFPEFLALKRKHNPDERFQSDWYRHYKKMFGA